MVAATLAGCARDRSAGATAPVATRTETTAADVTAVTRPHLQASGRLIRLCNILERPPGAPMSEAQGDAADRNLVDQLARCVRHGPLEGRRLQLTAHASWHGAGDYTSSTGASRADFTYELFLREGVAPEQLRQAPIATAQDPAATDAARKLTAERVDIDID